VVGALWDEATLAPLTAVREHYDPTAMFRTIGLR